MSVEPLPEPEPGEFDYGRYLRRRGRARAARGGLRRPHHHRPPRRPAGARRPAAPGVARAPAAPACARPWRRCCRAWSLGDDEGVDAGDHRRLPRQRPAAHHGRVRRERGAAVHDVVVRVRAARHPPAACARRCCCRWWPPTCCSPARRRPSCAPASPASSGLLAVLASRPSDGWLLWLAPAAWLLTANPNNLFDVSFQLSFAAVAGLLLLARPLTRAFSFLPGPLPEQVGVTTAASISTAPVSMLTFGSASLVSVPANAVGGFVLGPIMFLGMLSLLGGFVSEWLSAPLNVVAGLFIGFLLAVARFFAGLPGRGVHVPGRDAAAPAGRGPRRRARGGVRTGVAGRRRSDRLRARPPPLAAARRRDGGRGRGGAAPGAGAGAAARQADADVPRRRRGGGQSAAGARRADRARRRRSRAAGAPSCGEHAVGRSTCSCSRTGTTTTSADSRTSSARSPSGRRCCRTPRTASSAAPRRSTTSSRQLRAAGTDVRRCTSPLDVAATPGACTCCRPSPVGGVDQNQRENDDALVVVAELGGQRVLLPGDAEGQVLEDLDLPACLRGRGAAPRQRRRARRGPARRAGAAAGGDPRRREQLRAPRPGHARAARRPPASRRCAPTSGVTWPWCSGTGGWRCASGDGREGYGSSAGTSPAMRAADRDMPKGGDPRAGERAVRARRAEGARSATTPAWSPPASCRAARPGRGGDPRPRAPRQGRAGALEHRGAGAATGGRSRGPTRGPFSSTSG